MPSTPDQPRQSHPDDPADTISPVIGVTRLRRWDAHRVIALIALSVLALTIVAAAAFFAWAQKTYAENPKGLSSVQADSRIRLDVRDDVTVLSPTDGGDGRGLVFLPGAKVEPEAYAATFAEVAASGTTVVIAHAPLNLALLERRPFEDYMTVAPSVQTWAVGGHSMGGARACMYAETEEVKALILLASYCSGVDLVGHTDLAVLSVLGSEDGLIDSASLDDSREILPERSESIVIDGATHAQFGDYGPQDGDGVPTISDARARQDITAALLPLFERVSR